MERIAHYPEILDFILYSVNGSYCGLSPEGRDECSLVLEIRVRVDI